MNTVTTEDCKAVLKNYFPNKYAKLINFKLCRLSDKTLGFLGEHVRLNITYKDNEGKEEKQLNLFVKCLPENNKNLREYVDEMKVFTKETLIYRDVLPNLLQVSKKKFAPKCYLAKSGEFLVLENLNEASFATQNGTFSLKQCMSVLKTLAAFHSSSIIYEEKQSRNGTIFRFSEQTKSALQESTFSFTNGHVRQRWMENTTKALADCVQLYPQYKNNRQIVEKLWQFVRKDLQNLLKPSAMFRNVITHDDLWSNNIMFKKTTKGEIESILVDFQLARYTPPALDVLLFLYLNVESQLLEENKERFLDLYYKIFANNLSDHGLDPDAITSKSAFLDSLEVYNLPALYEAAMYGTNVYLSQELSKVIVSNQQVLEEFAFNNRSKYVIKEFEENASFKNRFSGVFIPLLECLV